MSTISGHTRGAEQAVGFSREATQCDVCRAEYTEEELDDPEKVIELYCDHNFHSVCINEWISTTMKDRDGPRKPNCPLCRRQITQLDSLPDQIGRISFLAAFENEEIFDSILQHCQKNNADDEGERRVLNEVAHMQADLLQIQQDLVLTRVTERELQNMFMYRAFLLVVDRKDIGIALKQDIMRAIECILRIGKERTDLRAPVSTDLRTAAEEAERWRAVPFQDWPEKMRTTEKEMQAKPKEEQTQEYGVVVQGKPGPMRVSGRHIQRWLTRPKVLKEVQIENLVIGPPELLKSIGVVEDPPPFPEEFKAIFNDPCVFYPGRPVNQTHIFSLCPEIMEIDGKSIRLSADNAPDIIHRLIKLHSQPISDIKETQLRSIKILKSRWVAMTKEAIPYSQYRSYKEQKEMIHELGKGLYECPSALDILLSTYLDFQKTGKFFGRKWSASLTEDMKNFSRCEERLPTDSPQDVIPGHVKTVLSPSSGELAFHVKLSFNVEIMMEYWPDGGIELVVSPDAVGMAAVRKIPAETA